MTGTSRGVRNKGTLILAALLACAGCTMQEVEIVAMADPPVAPRPPTYVTSAQRVEAVASDYCGAQGLVPRLAARVGDPAYFLSRYQCTVPAR